MNIGTKNFTENLPMSKVENFIFKKNDAYYFGVELKSFFSAINSLSDKDRLSTILKKSRLEFLNAIINPADSNLTYDFRIIYKPEESIQPIRFIFLVKYWTKDKEAAAAYAKSFHSLIKIYFNDITSELLSSKRVEYYLSPFKVESIYETKRRSDRVSLDTLKLSRNAKATSLQNRKCSSEHSILHIFRFIPSFESYDNFVRMIFDEGKPLLVSCMLRPTILRNELIEFFEQQIIECEKYAQIAISSLSDDTNNLYPTLKEQAHLYQNELLKFYHGLKDNCALLQIRIASKLPVSSLLLESFNTLLTEPSGGYSDREVNLLHSYLKGGYSNVKLDDEYYDNLIGINNLEICINNEKTIEKELTELLYLFDSNESVSAFKPPFFIDDNIPGVKVRRFRHYDMPYNYSASGVVIGMSTQNNKKVKVKISEEDRKRHAYIVGQTGTGKTTLLKQMILNDMQEGKGLCLLDPHGDLFNEVLSSIPNKRIQDVVLIDPNDIEYPVALNILECSDLSHSYFVAQEMVDIITKLMIDEYGETAIANIAGPIFFQHIKMNFLLCMSNPENPGTLLEFYQIFNSKDYWKRWLPLKVKDKLLENWTENVLPSIDYTQFSNDSTSMGGYIGSKFSNFVFEPKLRNIFGQKKSTIDFKRIMDEGKIVLVNLAKGELTESTSRFFGMVVLAKIQADLMKRLSTPPKKRVNFNLYVDEFQSIATKNFITLLSEGRKFGISLVLSNQFLFQVSDSIMNSIFGNCGTIICFRLGLQDAEKMEAKFQPAFNKTDLMNLPNWIACISTLENGQIISPFNLETIYIPQKQKSDKIPKAVKVSRNKYSRSKEEVEEIIKRSF